MSRKPIHSSPGEPSFFYLMMAGTCFQRAARHRQAGTLRDIGRNYLTKATKVTSALQSQPSAIGRDRSPAHCSIRDRIEHFDRALNLQQPLNLVLRFTGLVALC
jgi:hypothetical protein